MREIVLKKPIGRSLEYGGGVYSFILAREFLKEAVGDLEDIYKRKGLCLKVFIDPVVSFDDFVWGYRRKDSRSEKEGPHRLLKECTIIQNLFAFEDLAPRVYDVVFLKGIGRNYFAQVTDYLEEEFQEGPREKLVLIRSKYGLGMNYDPNLKNWIDGKLVDFQMFWITDHQKYQDRLRHLANNQTDWGSKTGISYESVDELGVKGQRNTKRRAEVLKMDEYNFENKTVLDIGCSTGSFCNYANQRGAGRVVGFDIGENIPAAREISNYLGNWNIDYYDYHFNKDDPKDYENIKRITGLDSFDIVFFLSVHAQIGYPTTYMAKLCNEVCFVEGHSGHHEETYRSLMEKDFSRVVFEGRMKNSARPALVGIK